MRDWQAFVRGRMNGRGLSHDQQNEITAELAAHLEDVCEERHAQCANEAEAICYALEEVANWHDLSRRIRRAKETNMSSTTKTLWVPGMGMLFCATILFFAMARLVPPAAWLAPKAPVLLMGPWLLSYLAFGALGAWWSRRAGGSTYVNFFSGIFPLALHLAIYLTFLVGFTTGVPNFSEHINVGQLFAFGLKWVVIPGLALAVGTAPFLRDPHGRRTEMPA